MYRNRNQKEFVIHQIKGSRSPQPPKTFNRIETNENDETESDEEFIPRRTVRNNLQKDNKNLILGKVEDYALVNTSKNVRLEPNANRISSFIIKESPIQEDRFYPSLIRSPMTMANRNPNSFKYPYHQNRKGSNVQDSGEIVYVKKKVPSTLMPTDSSCKGSHVRSSSRYSNPKDRITYYDLQEEEALIPQQEEMIMENAMRSNEIWHLQALKIQTAWRGYNLRLHLFENLNIFYQTHRAVSQLEYFIDKKRKRMYWNKLKQYLFTLKKIYIKNHLNLGKIPIKYNTKAIISQFGLNVYRKELSESFQFIRKKQGGAKEGDTATMYETKEDKFIDYPQKYKEKVLRQLLITKLNKENYSLKNYFNHFLVGGMRASINIIKNDQKKATKQQLLKSLLKNKGNKSNQQLKKNFLKLYFNGTLKQVNALLRQSNEGIKQANQSKKLIKLVLEKEKGTEDNLRKSFQKYNSTIIIFKEIEDIEKSKDLSKDKKLHKLITTKEKGNKLQLKQYFMKLYYNGLFKVMNCQPQKKMEDPKTILKRKLRRMVSKKETDNKKNLKDYFLKYYYGGIYKEFKAKSYSPSKTKEPLSIITDSIIIESVSTPRRDAQTTKEKRMTMRQLIKAKKKGANDNLRKAFWKFYLTGVFRQLKTTGLIEDRTNPKSSRQQTRISINDSLVNPKKGESVKANKPIVSEQERNRRLKELVIDLNKANESKVKNALKIFNLKCQFLKNQKLREAKLKTLVIKKDMNIRKTLVVYFTKFNLKAKLMHIKGILNKQKRRKKKKKQPQTHSQSQSGISVESNIALEHSNNPSDIMPESIPEEDYDDDSGESDFGLDDDNEEVVNYDDYQCNTTPQPSRPIRLKAAAKPTKVNLTEGDQTEEINSDDLIISRNNMKLMIMKHVKLMNIIDNQNEKYLSKYFSIWHNPISMMMTSMERQSYKVALFIKIISHCEGKIKNRHLKTRFNQWKKSGSNIHKNIKETIAISRLSRIIKKITYLKYFERFYSNYFNYLKSSQLRKVINNMDMRIVRLNNKHIRNRFYCLAGKKPQLSVASSVINLMNSFQKVEDSFELIRNTRDKRRFFTLLNRKAAWERPLNINFTVRKITYYLKNGNIVHLDRNDKILRNFLWRYKNPKKYYFRKMYAKVLKVKERELESQSRKWEYEDFNPIENRNSARKQNPK